MSKKNNIKQQLFYYVHDFVGDEFRQSIAGVMGIFPGSLGPQFG